MIQNESRDVMGIGQFFSLPDDVICKAAMIRIMEDKYIIVENFRSILEFENDYIELKTTHGTIAMYGKHFEIESYNDEEIKICGIIKTISFGV